MKTLGYREVPIQSYMARAKGVRTPLQTSLASASIPYPYGRLMGSQCGEGDRERVTGFQTTGKAALWATTAPAASSGHPHLCAEPSDGPCLFLQATARGWV